MAGGLDLRRPRPGAARAAAGPHRPVPADPPAGPAYAVPPRVLARRAAVAGALLRQRARHLPAAGQRRPGRRPRTGARLDRVPPPHPVPDLRHHRAAAGRGQRGRDHRGRRLVVRVRRRRPASSRAALRNRPEAIAQIVADGQRIGTGGAWRCAPGTTRYADLQMGEYQDARLATDGWDQPGYDDSGWDRAAVVRAAPPRCWSPSPTSRSGSWPNSRAIPADSTVVDFGQNVTGRVRLTIRGAPAGRRIQVRHGEVLDAAGAVHREPPHRRGHRHLHRARPRGRGVRARLHRARVPLRRDHRAPGGRGRRHGAGAAQRHPLGRRVLLLRPADQPARSRISSWGQRGNFVAVPTDCPQRDERLGWMGDAQVFVPHGRRNADVAAFFTNWLRDVDDGQRADGAYSDVAPHDGAGEGAPAWADAGVICPWTLYRSYGDRRILEQSCAAMTRWVEYIRGAQPGLIWRNRTRQQLRRLAAHRARHAQGPDRDRLLRLRSARVVADAARLLRPRRPPPRRPGRRDRGGVRSRVRRGRRDRGNGTKPATCSRSGSVWSRAARAARRSAGWPPGGGTRS